MNQKPSLFEIMLRPADAEVSLETKGSERYPVLIAVKRDVLRSNLEVVSLSVGEGKSEAIE